MATPTPTRPPPAASPPLVTRSSRHPRRSSDNATPVTPVPLVPISALHVRRLALTGLRLALGIEFLWAFLDKTFGLGYATPTARAWINGGSPTKGFLSHVSSGPLS